MIRDECRKVAKRARSFLIQRLIRNMKKLHQMKKVKCIDEPVIWLDTRITSFEKRLKETRVRESLIEINVISYK